MEDKKYNELCKVYKMIAEQYLYEKYSIGRLDQRFSEQKIPFEPIKRDKEEVGQQLRYITLSNHANIERLESEELNELEKIADGYFESINILNFVESTYRKVLAGDIRPNVKYEFYPNIHGEGILPGDAIVFLFHDQVTYDLEGKIDWEIEGRKETMFKNVKVQFEALANRNSETPIYLVRQ